jgi:NADH dehydrogenase FAD-containing subunit
MADVVLLCVGITQANSRLLRNIPGALDSSGFVRANRFLQLICEPDNSVNDSTPHKSVRPVNAQLSTLAQGAQHVFVAGDVSFGTEERTAQAAQARARVVSQNIRLLHARQTLSTTENKSQLVTASGPGLIEYLPNPKPMIVSLGPWDGVLTYKGWTIKGFIPAVLKEVVEWKCMSSYWYYTPLPF